MKILYLCLFFILSCSNKEDAIPAPKAFETECHMDSRILMTVASPDKGKVRFALSLDGIQSVGEASN